jgi:hypothetical protein
MRIDKMKWSDERSHVSWWWWLWRMGVSAWRSGMQWWLVQDVASRGDAREGQLRVDRSNWAITFEPRMGWDGQSRAEQSKPKQSLISCIVSGLVRPEGIPTVCLGDLWDRLCNTIIHVSGPDCDCMRDESLRYGQCGIIFALTDRFNDHFVYYSRSRQASPAIRDPAVRLMTSCNRTTISTVPLLKYSSLTKGISFNEFPSAINHTMRSDFSCWGSNTIACSCGTTSSRPLRKKICHLRSKTRFN